MSTVTLSDCPSCGARLAPPAGSHQIEGRCGQCKTTLLVNIYPRAHTPGLEGSPATPRERDGESACFHHPDAVAVESCHQCGRFLCSVCDLPIDNKHYCSACLARAEEDGTDMLFVKSRERYDFAALQAFSLPIGLGVIAALFSLFDGDPFLPISAFFGTAITVGIFAVPFGLWSIYKSNKPQTGTTKPSYTLLRIFALLIVVWIGMMIFGFFTLMATEPDLFDLPSPDDTPVTEEQTP